MTTSIKLPLRELVSFNNMYEYARIVQIIQWVCNLFLNFIVKSIILNPQEHEVSCSQFGNIVFSSN